MANSIMVLKCKWCKTGISLGKGYYGDMRIERACPKKYLEKINKFYNAHGSNCKNALFSWDDSSEHYEIAEFYSDTDIEFFDE